MVTKWYAAVVERDSTLGKRVEVLLGSMNYDVRLTDTSLELSGLVRTMRPALAVLGETVEGKNMFDLLKLTVRESPMTSIILLTDLPESQVHELAEGYGILGSVSRKDPEIPLKELCARLEQIEQAVSMVRNQS